MNKNNITLSARNLKFYYETRKGRRIDAVKSVSFDLERGKVLGVAGESGSGKSTLVNGLLGLNIPGLYRGAGEVIIDDKDIYTLSQKDLRVNILGKKISIIPQGALNALNPTRRVLKFASDVLLEHEPNLSSDDIYNRLVGRFSQIGLSPAILDKYPAQLSGGMRQRVVIAISTIMNPDVVVADEPTSALDVSTQKSVIIMLKDLMKKGIFGSMIFITHELPLLYHVADDIAVMNGGEIVEIGDCEQVIHSPVNDYTKMLMSEAKKLDAHGTRHGKREL